MTQQTSNAVRMHQAMRVHVEPAMSQWNLQARDSTDRRALLQCAADHAAIFESGRPNLQQSTQPLIATGHQAWLWHPGILAKDLAMVAAANKFNAQMLHLVVDQDVHEALALELPVKNDDSLRVERVRLARELPDVPAACQAAVDAKEVVATLQKARATWGKNLCVDLQPLMDAWRDLPAQENLAMQIAAVEHRLMQPFSGPMPMILATDLITLPMFGNLLSRMLDDAPRCVHLYNRAVAVMPEARIGQLIEERERVELPVWALAGNGARLRLFADLANSKPALALEDGTLVEGDELIENTVKISQMNARAASGKNGLAMGPRALLLTAIMRSVGCDLFIHGRGGAIYDRITEAWWKSWMNETLTPLAMVSADLFLSIDVPVAQQADVQRAQWWLHHLPHNVDRALGWNAKQIARKQTMLAQLAASGSYAEKQVVFRALHELNATWLGEHENLLHEAKAQLHRATIGMNNHSITGKRDWCFALYPRQVIEALKNKFVLN